MSAPPGWIAQRWSSLLHLCLHALLFFISLLILSSTPCFPDRLPPFLFDEPRSTLSVSSPPPSSSLSEFRGGWKSLSSELSGSAKGHRPNHPGWLWMEPAAVISSALSGLWPKKDNKDLLTADQMERQIQKNPGGTRNIYFFKWPPIAIRSPH